jgi:hypothetical protein
LQRTPAKYIAAPSCTRSAHAVSQAIDIENESYRSIIGAAQKRCDRGFIQLTLREDQAIQYLFGTTDDCIPRAQRPNTVNRVASASTFGPTGIQHDDQCVRNTEFVVKRARLVCAENSKGRLPTAGSTDRRNTF